MSVAFTLIANVALGRSTLIKTTLPGWSFLHFVLGLLANYLRVNNPMDDWIEALQNFFSNEKKGAFDYSLTSTITPWAWILFLIAAALLVLLGIWAFLGEIPITVSGRGLVVTENGFSSLPGPFYGSCQESDCQTGRPR